MSIKQYSYIAFWLSSIFLSYFGKILKNLGFIMYVGDYFHGGKGIVLRNIAKDVMEPLLRFRCPGYLDQVLIRCAISSFDMSCPLRTSSMPRSTILANASSRKISSNELSSGCDCNISAIRSFVVGILCTSVYLNAMAW
jgi:hypothetical protein